jgi:hypothetical protein
MPTGIPHPPRLLREFVLLLTWFSYNIYVTMGRTRTRTSVSLSGALFYLGGGRWGILHTPTHGGGCEGGREPQWHFWISS